MQLLYTVYLSKVERRANAKMQYDRAELQQRPAQTAKRAFCVYMKGVPTSATASSLALLDYVATGCLQEQQRTKVEPTEPFIVCCKSSASSYDDFSLSARCAQIHRSLLGSRLI